MASLPGHVGMPLLGDTSVEFYRDVFAFTDGRINKYDSRLFVARFLNTPTVFVASNKGVHELLTDSNECYEMGYKQFMESIYGDNIVFSNGNNVMEIRTILEKLLHPNESHAQLTGVVERYFSKFIAEIKDSKPVELYAVFKRLVTEICLTFFLDVNFENSTLANDIVSLTTTHWHGIVSVPLNLKIPMMNRQSAFGRAVEAKEKLLQIIDQKLSNLSIDDTFLKRIKKAQPESDDLARNHILLFTSALVPKALASLLTTFVVQTANRKQLLNNARAYPENLEDILLEVERLWPPFQGGRRVAVKNTQLDEYHIPSGHAVVFLTSHAHRDPSVFVNPTEFSPKRWKEANKDDKNKLFTFGGGQRNCLGQHLVSYILKTVCGRLVEEFDWDICAGQSLEYKWLPVARPKDNITVTFRPRS